MAELEPDFGTLRPAPLLHGFVRLRRDHTLPTGVIEAGPEVADVRSTSDLPEHRLELHVFRTFDQASAFRLGIMTAGSNHVAVSGVCGPSRNAVVLARLDQDRPVSEALADAVALFNHGADLQVLAQSSRRQDTLFVRDRTSEAVLASWRDALEALDLMTPPRSPQKGEEQWIYARAEVHRPGHGEPTGHLTIRGTLNPDPPQGETAFGMAHERRVLVKRLADGSVRAVLDRDSFDESLREPSVSRHLGQIRDACRKAGWEFDGDKALPVWRGHLRAESAASFALALSNGALLSQRLNEIVRDAKFEDRVERVCASETYTRFMHLILEDPDCIVRPSYGLDDATVYSRGEQSPFPRRAVFELDSMGYLYRANGAMRPTEIAFQVARAIAERAIPAPPSVKM